MAITYEPVHNLKIIREERPNLMSLKDESFDALFAIHALEYAPTYETVGHNFWDQDWSHCYPTTTKRVTQLLLGLTISIDISATTRSGSINPFKKCVALGRAMSTNLLNAFNNHESCR